MFKILLFFILCFVVTACSEQEQVYRNSCLGYYVESQPGVFICKEKTVTTKQRTDKEASSRAGGYY